LVHLYAFVRCRDGTRLATDLYLPKKYGSFPTIVQRTPYGKYDEGLVAYGEWVTEHGYACAIQDVRGRHDSEGTWHPYDNREDADGFDTIEWITKQRWSNGAVAFTGSSYLAFTGFMATLTQHTAMKAVIARVPASGLYHHHFYHGGIFSLGRLMWGTLANRRVLQSTTCQGEALPVFHKLIVEEPDVLFHLPVEEIGEIFPMPVPWWRTWLQHQTEDEYWRRLEIVHHFDKVPIPIYHIGGWHDDFCSVPLENFTAALRATHSSPDRAHRLLMGMWPHRLNLRTDHGGIDYGPQAVIDLWEREKRWLDQWLLGLENELSGEPPIRLFVMGANEWGNYQRWPPETVETVPLFLRQRGRLSFEPARDKKSDTYIYDPLNPTPQPWDFGEPEMPDVPGWSVEASSRGDRLIYVSPPLDEPLTLIGPVILHLFAASDAKDTDWFAWVAWEDPETGQVRLLTRGYAIRARFRHGFKQPTLLKPKEVFAYEINLGATARLLPREARLLCCIQSSCSPWYTRNLNTGGDNYRETEAVSATQTVYHDREHPSRIMLPLVPGDRRGDKK